MIRFLGSEVKGQLVIAKEFMCNLGQHSKQMSSRIIRMNLQIFCAAKLKIPHLRNLDLLPYLKHCGDQKPFSFADSEGQVSVDAPCDQVLHLSQHIFHDINDRHGWK